MIAEQAAAIGELKADVVALAAEVRELRRRLGRNSGNSSMAPSADDLPGRLSPPTKPRRGKGGRKPGKQPGAPGAHLAWSERPDETVPPRSPKLSFTVPSAACI
jgi:transposase